MARLYRDPTLQHQIDLTLTRLILGGVNVRAYIACTLDANIYHIYNNRVQLVSTYNKMFLLL